jgi:DNA-binding NarL/FixJ family response regulator
MSFAGNLEDLAIVDVIQLLHSTRKSGTLCVSCHKGRSQIVFNNGYIVSASHYDESIRIGKILVEMEAIDEDTLNQALDIQRRTEGPRKPLIGTLIELGAIDKKLAYKGLECLIEMTIVNIVSWKKGTFTLDVDVTEISDEYRYIPDKLEQELNFDTQMVLMDALRIYDERMAARGDLPEDDDEPEDETSGSTPVESDDGESLSLDLSADILGLDTIDQIAVKIPETFTGLEAFDPSEMHRQKVREVLPDFPSLQREELVEYLGGLSGASHLKNEFEEHRSLILYTTNELVQHGLLSSCNHAGIKIFSALTPLELDNLIRQNLERTLVPVVVFDCPLANREGFSHDELTAARQQLTTRYPELQVIQLFAPVDYLYSLQALQTGASAVLPRSLAENRRESFIGDFIQFLQSFPVFIHRFYRQQAGTEQPDHALWGRLRLMKSANEIAFFLLEQTSHFFERSMILIVRAGVLQAEKSFGIESDKSKGPSAPLKFEVPLSPDSLLAKTVADGSLFFGAVNDKVVREAIFGEISAPDKSKILLLPLVAGNKTLAMIYADFGQSHIRKINTEILQNFAWVCGLTLEQIIRNRQKPAKN